MNISKHIQSEEASKVIGVAESSSRGNKENVRAALGSRRSQSSQDRVKEVRDR